jgi:excisionase family DNA binding protein
MNPVICREMQETSPAAQPWADSEMLLTVKELATMLRVSPAWVRDHATRKQPRLPVVPVGKLLRFRREDIIGWIEEQKKLAARLKLAC